MPTCQLCSSCAISVLFLFVFVASGSVAAAPALTSTSGTEPRVLNVTCAFADQRNLFLEGLETHNASLASRVIESCTTPAGPTGNAPLSVDSVNTLVSQAAVDLAYDFNNTINQSAFADSLAQLPEIAATSKANLIQAYAQALLGNMEAQALSGNMAADHTASLLVLANASGLNATQLFTAAFSAAKADGVSANTIATELHSQVALAAQLSAAQLSAANNIYGITPQNVQQAQGNVTFLGALLLGSATLTLQPPPGTANSTAVQLVTSAVSAARLSPQTRQEAFAQAILQGLQVQAESIIAPSSVPIILSINANAILAAAAFSTQSMNAVAEAFAEAKDTPLQSFCQIQAQIAAFSPEASKAVGAAIPAVFGANACLRVGTSMYFDSNNYTKAETSCTAVLISAQEADLPPNPELHDCLEAALQLQAKGDSPCVVPYSTPSNASSATFGTLAKVGSCQIILGGGILTDSGVSVGNALPCSKVADYAKNIGTVCVNSRMMTGGVLQPNGTSYDAIYVKLSG